MNRYTTRWTTIGLVMASLTIHQASAQTFDDTPRTRLRPIGSPSAVDKYRRSDLSSVRFRQAAYQTPASGQVRQAVMQFEAPQLPENSGLGLPSNTALPGSSAPSSPVDTGPPVAVPSTAPRSLPSNPALPSNSALPSNPAIAQQVPVDRSGIASSSDLSAVPQPRLGGGFATIDNCNCISPASAYTAASGIGCGTPIRYAAPPAYVAPPAQIAAPAVLPGGFVVIPNADAAPVGALLSFGQESNPVQVGQGILGQPVAYVPGQRIRNWIRYIFP